MACTGVGATLVFSNGITYVGRYRSISGLQLSVESLDDTALDSTDYMEACPDDLASLEPLDISVAWDFRDPIPPVGDLGTITLTMPIQTGQATAATIVGSGFITSATFPDLAVGQIMDGTMQIKFDGKTGPAFTAAT